MAAGRNAQSAIGATGSSIAPYGAVALAAFRGQEAQAAHLIQIATDDVGRRGGGRALSFIGWAAAVLYNSVGRYEEALTAAQRASEDSPAMHFASWAFVELVEAAVRSGVPERAAGAVAPHYRSPCRTDSRAQPRVALTVPAAPRPGVLPVRLAGRGGA